MLNIILLLMAGSAFAYLSKDNLSPVTLHVAHYTFADIPLFYVIVGSLLIGLVLSYIVQLLGSITTAWVLRGNRNKIKSSQNEILELTKRIHQLELENEKLKHTGPEIVDTNAL